MTLIDCNKVGLLQCLNTDSKEDKMSTGCSVLLM